MPETPAAKRGRKKRYGLSRYIPTPAKQKSAKSDSVASIRCRSGHDKAKPQSGRISALAGRKGRLRACIGVSLDLENYCTVSLFFAQAYL